MDYMTGSYPEVYYPAVFWPLTVASLAGSQRVYTVSAESRSEMVSPDGRTIEPSAACRTYKVKQL